MSNAFRTTALVCKCFWEKIIMEKNSILILVIIYPLVFVSFLFFSSQNASKTYSTMHIQPKASIRTASFHLYSLLRLLPCSFCWFLSDLDEICITIEIYVRKKCWGYWSLELIYNVKQRTLHILIVGKKTNIIEEFLMTKSLSKILEKTFSLIDILKYVKNGDFDCYKPAVLFKGNRKEYYIRVRLFGND
jgi:hypothetical protein